GQHEVLAPTEGEGAVEVGDRPRVPGRRVENDPRILTGKLFANRCRSIGRGIVGDVQLELAKVLGQQGGDGLSNVSFAVVRGHADREGRLLASHLLVRPTAAEMACMMAPTFCSWEKSGTRLCEARPISSERARAFFRASARRSGRAGGTTNPFLSGRT